MGTTQIAVCALRTDNRPEPHRRRRVLADAGAGERGLGCSFRREWVGKVVLICDLQAARE